MKWPKRVTLIRHDTSAYNALRDLKKEDPLYQEFLCHFKQDPEAEATITLAQEVEAKFSLKVGDAETPLLDAEGTQAYKTGVALSEGEVPDVVFVSPYLRAVLTLEHLTRGWPALKEVKTYEDERIREQEHGLALLYNDWRVFHVLHPEQRRLYEIEGAYWYRYPQGENVPDVRARNRSWTSTLVRDFAGKIVLGVTHHLNILAIRANQERLSAKEFLRLDEEEKPINCGVTTYLGHPDQGNSGRLILESYNVKHY